MFKLSVSVILLLSSVFVKAVPITWVDWETSDGDSAAGSAGSISVDVFGPLSPAAQTNGGIDYWAVNPSVYTGVGVDNGPVGSDIVRITEGDFTIDFGQTVLNPVMAILSLGRASLPTTYVFDTEFEVLNQGSGYWGGGSLAELTGNVLEGREGHGLIQFQGAVDSISFVSSREAWHGFTLGVATEVDEPAHFGVAALGFLALLGLRRRRHQVK